MLFNTFISSKEDLTRCLSNPSIGEVLIEPEVLAREGRLSVDDSCALAKACNEAHLPAVLVWDLLMTDSDFETCAEALDICLNENFSAVRVQCIGAANYIKKKFPNTKLQWIAETANCNLHTLKLISELFAGQLDRIILSVQLPAEKVKEYVKELSVKCEVLGIGRILLFYSRRNLLRKNFADLGDVWREVLASSEDSHQRPFPVIDNRHGTFMYLDKDQFIMHKLSQLEGVLPAFFRLDLRHLSAFPNSADEVDKLVEQLQNNPDAVKDSWPRPTLAPFFRANLTTKQFKYLNSPLWQARDKDLIAEVITSERESHAVWRVIAPFEIPGLFRALDPEGKQVTFNLKSLKSLSGEQITKADVDQIVVAPWIRKISMGSLVFLPDIAN